MPLPQQFHPAVRAWFDRRFAEPTPAQSRGWAEILAGRDTLIAAPTGSGKTLAAFLASVDALVGRAALPGSGGSDRGGGAAGPGEQSDLIEVVYVSPLKALSSDVQRNLELPLEGIGEAAKELGLPPPAIRVALRTGDTTPAARAAILRRVPHILITTPESLYLMLTAERSRGLLRGVRTVIVDELHALMRDKRGSHLALSLARLDAVAATRPQRIGLSATVHPIEEAARFLVGHGRPCAIVDVGHRRDLDLTIEVPSTDLQAVATHEQWGEIYDRLAALVLAHRTTLIFVNTRRMAERVAHHLGERLGEDRVGAHHGSLAKDRRLRIEQRLKAGEMRALAATASLELGIDVGSVDLVCQVGSPRAVTTLLQRIGRSGHALGRTSRGRLFATSRDELVECAALVRAVAGGRLDRIEPPRAPLDVLAQQIVAECSAREWTEDALFDLFRQATPFAETESRRLRRGRRERLRRRCAPGSVGAARWCIAIASAGRYAGAARPASWRSPTAARSPISPTTASCSTRTRRSSGRSTRTGRSRAWRGTCSSSGRTRGASAGSSRGRACSASRTRRGQPPSIPFWLGEAPSRTWELSVEVSRLRADVVAQDRRGRRAGVVARGVRLAGRWRPRSSSAYVSAQRDALGIVPTMDDVVFERFFDEAGGMQLVVHAPFGGRVNRAFGLALRKRFCVSFDFELQAAATDDAIVLSMGTTQSFPLSDAFHFVRADRLEATLEQAILAAPMFATRWRWNASRALAVLRIERGKKVPPFLQRMRSDDLLAAVFPAQAACQENVRGPLEVPDHPLVRQTVRDCLYEAMDTERLRGLLQRMERGEIRLHARDVTEPSPFSHEILNAKPYAFLDDAPLEERRARAVSLRRTLPDHQRDLGALDPAAIDRVVAEARPQPRDADELHDLLLGLVVMPLEDEWSEWFAELARTGRGARVEPSPEAKPLLFATECARTIEALYPGAPRLELPARLEGPRPSREDAVLAAVRGHAEVAGPFTAGRFAARLGLEEWEVAAAVARLESEGLVLRGRFGGGGRGEGDSDGEEQFCDRRLLARIHRYTMDRLRAEIEPVSAQDLMRYLLERHHLGSRARAGGRAGLRDAVAMLQGFEIGAAAWEKDILAPRVAGYRSEWLDELCLAGEVAWGRLSPRRATSGSAATGSISRTTPIAIAQRRDLGWLLLAVRGAGTPEPPSSGPSTSTLEALRRRGALFLDDLSLAAGIPREELAGALWDLVGRGLVAGDGFQPLRELMARGRGALEPRARSRRGVAQGRWSLFERTDVEASLPDEVADRVAQQLLARYGVVFRELTARESFTVPWRDVLRALRAREARGLVRGGRFVAGFLGEQYALPEAVDALRRIRRTARVGEAVRVSAADPLNLAGIVTPGARVPSNRGPWVVFVDGALESGRTENARPPADAEAVGRPLAV